MTADQMAEVEWRDGVTPVSASFDDPYFSITDGYGESCHVFLEGNDLPARFKPGFHVAELGFGTGLNMLAGLIAWTESGQTGPLRFTSFEAYPMRAADIRLALLPFPAVQTVAGPFLDQWQSGKRLIRTPNLIAEIVIGDARKTLPAWKSSADAWFLDGFSPAKNPEMWGDRLLADVARHTAPGGTFATYTAAGHVRRNLTAAEFEVRRVAGFGRKRHMTIGQLKAAL